MKEVITSSNGYPIPYVGRIYILGRKPNPKQPTPQWQESMKYKKIIHTFNDHTNGLIYKFKCKYYKPSKNAYLFKANRKWNRELSKYIKANYKNLMYKVLN